MRFYLPVILLSLLYLIPDPLTAQKDEAIFAPVEIMPEFPGGEEALMDFIRQETRYPKAARDKGIQGRVFVQFVIDTAGQVIEARILRGVHALLDEEALRVINAMPDWSPGTQRGKPVRVSYNLPINFQLAGKKKKKKRD